MTRLRLFRVKDLLLYIAIACVTIGVLLTLNRTGSDMIIVKINKTTVYRFSLLEEATKTIESDNGKLMDVVIKDEDAYIKNSTCPLHLCEEGSIAQTGALVCVPNRVIITYDTDQMDIDNEDHRGYDLMTK